MFNVPVTHGKRKAQHLFTMAEGGELYLTDNGSEHVFDFYCELCREDGKMLEAEGYCVSCGEYLCGTCYTHHRRTRGTRHHVLLDKDEMPKDTPLSHERVSKDITKICEHHAGKPVEYYCKWHDILGCSMCIIKGHSSCSHRSNVESIPEMAESIIESQEYKQFIQRLKQCEQRSSENIKIIQDNVNKSKQCCLEVAKSLKKFREEINSILDELEKNILKQAEDFQKEVEDTSMSVSKKFTSSLKLAEKITEELSQLQKSGKVCDMYIRLKESKSGVTDIQSNIDKAEKEIVATEYTFDPRAELKECLRSHEGLGNLYVQEPVSVVPMALPHSNPVNTMAIHVHEIDIDVKLCKDDHVGAVSGSAVVSNNRLIIIDNYKRNVHLTDIEKNKMISTLNVSMRPWDVTVINRNQAAVTAYDRRTVLLLNVSDTLTFDREITVNGQCRGLAYSKNRLVVTYVSPGKLEVMNLSGKVMKVVENDSDGNNLFVRPNYVCVSNDGEYIYVSDYAVGKVFCLNFDGIIKSVYSDIGLKHPLKVCVDKDDNVFVCCYYSKAVHMLSSNLNKIKIILTKQDGLVSHVQAVSHCQETNRLFVGMWQNNKMKVYQLSQ